MGRYMACLWNGLIIIYIFHVATMVFSLFFTEIERNAEEKNKSKNSFASQVFQIDGWPLEMRVMAIYSIAAKQYRMLSANPGIFRSFAHKTR